MKKKEKERSQRLLIYGSEKRVMRSESTMLAAKD